MVIQEVTAEERQEAILEELRRLGPKGMNVTAAWTFGHQRGLYQGGEASKVKDDLNALCQRQQARRHDGFWRHIGEPDSMRLKYKQWADYWTARGGNN